MILVLSYKYLSNFIHLFRFSLLSFHGLLNAETVIGTTLFQRCVPTFFLIFFLPWLRWFIFGHSGNDLHWYAKQSMFHHILRGCTFRGGNCQIWFAFLQKRPTLRKEFAPVGSKLFPFRIDPISENEANFKEMQLSNMVSLLPKRGRSERILPF